MEKRSHEKMHKLIRNEAQIKVQPEIANLLC